VFPDRASAGVSCHLEGQVLRPAGPLHFLRGTEHGSQNRPLTLRIPRLTQGPTEGVLDPDQP